MDMASSLYTQTSASNGEPAWLLQQPIDNDDSANQDVDMLDQPAETVGDLGGPDDLAAAVPATVFCYGCGQSLVGMEDMFRHLHDAHGMQESLHCPCARCLFSSITPLPELTASAFGGQSLTTTNNSVPQSTAPAPIVAHGTTVTTVQLAKEADIWSTISETNLPPLLGQLEAGSLLTSRDGSVVYRTRTAAPPPLTDADGNMIRSLATHRIVRDIAFLPAQISATIPIWHLHFFERLAASKGVDLLHTDIMDRLPPNNSVSKAGLDMKLQRYRASMGYLPLVNKDLGRKLAFQANVSTIEDLMVWQAKANTVWLPTHMGRRGPWKVVQPDWCEGYKDRVADGIRGRGSYILKTLPGISDRVRNIADSIVYLDCKLIELSFTPVAELDQESLALKQKVMSWCGTLEPCSATRAVVLKRTSNAEFTYWLGRFRSGPSLKMIRRALEVAEASGGVAGQDYGKVLGGDEEVIRILSRN